MISDFNVSRLVYWAHRHRRLLAEGIADGTRCTAEAAQDLAALERLLAIIAPPPEPPGLRNSRGHVD